MERGPLSLAISGLLLAVGAAVALTALSLPMQPYTGLTLRGDHVAGVAARSPGEAAGIRAGDRVRLPGTSHPSGRTRGALAQALPGIPLPLEVQRAGSRLDVTVTPTHLPEDERRLRAALLAVACGFLLLGGWVWSERRDRLTRTFLLLCLAFAWLLAPLPYPDWPFVSLTHEIVLAGASVLLPALFIHFFALFPESRQARGRLGAWVSAGYLVAAALFAGSLVTLALETKSHGGGQAILTLVQIAAALWFALGLLLALALFTRSYLRARSADTRRRLRIVLAGTALGVGPLAGVIVARNLFPDVEVPFERAAVVLTLLVPASFAWAAVVHRVFDFRVALRSGVLVLVLAAAGVLAYFGSEWITGQLWPELGASLAGGSLAFIALAAALVGPAHPFLRQLGHERTAPPDPTEPATVALGGDAEAVAHRLADACATFARSFGLGACAAWLVDGDRVTLAAYVGARPAFAPGPALLDAGVPQRVPVPVDEITHDARERAMLDQADVRWVVGVGHGAGRALLTLGNRLAGAWFSTRELVDLEAGVAHLEVALENVRLRRAATSRTALDREMREAGRIQAHYLPRRVPVYPTLDCAAAALACQTVGGDYYDFVEGEDRTFTLAVGDARGHGVPAALTLAGVQARFRSEARHQPEPHALLRRLNDELVQLDHPENFVGLLCARFEARAGRVSFANAGLTPPLLRRADGRFEELTEAGVLLGVSAAADYRSASTQLGAGDLVVVYTDGLTEAQRGEELFGVERVRALVDRHAARRSADILRALVQAVRDWADRPLDDLTVVVMKQLTATARARRNVFPQAVAEDGRYRSVRRQDAVFPVRAANPRAADTNG
jgi:serine phosphatase RsbU (regulator of sigma subunit)